MSYPPGQNLIGDEIPELLETLEQRRDTRRMAHGCIWALPIYGVLGIALSASSTSPLPLACAGGLLLLNVVWLRLASTSEMATLRRICHYKDVRSLPALMDSLFEQEFAENMYLPVTEALAAALPLVARQHNESFTPRHRQLLHSLFVLYHDAQLCKSLIARDRIELRLHAPLPPALCRSAREGALHALVHIGDAETARVLRNFVKRRCRTHTQMELQQSALKSLLELEKRLALENDAQTLLRASQYTEDHLLRPSYAAPQEPPETLLRAVQPVGKGDEE